MGMPGRIFLFFFQYFSHGFAFMLMDICTEIRILFNREPVRYREPMNECHTSRKDCLGQVIKGAQMVGWKVGEGEALREGPAGASGK